MPGKTVTIRLNESQLKDYELLSEKLGVSIGKAIKWGSNQYHFEEKNSKVKDLQIISKMLLIKNSILKDALERVEEMMNEIFVQGEDGLPKLHSRYSLSEEFDILLGSASKEAISAFITIDEML